MKKNFGVVSRAQARGALGRALPGSLFFSQFVALYITPVIYICLDRLHNRLAWRSRSKAASAAKSFCQNV